MKNVVKIFCSSFNFLICMTEVVEELFAKGGITVTYETVS